MVKLAKALSSVVAVGLETCPPSLAEVVGSTPPSAFSVEAGCPGKQVAGELMELGLERHNLVGGALDILDTEGTAPNMAQRLVAPDSSDACTQYVGAIERRTAGSRRMLADLDAGSSG